LLRHLHRLRLRRPRRRLAPTVRWSWPRMRARLRRHRRHRRLRRL